MSIKQNGGVFGRNPTFNDVTIDGTLTFNGDIDIDSDLKVSGDLDVTGAANLASLNVTPGISSLSVVDTANSAVSYPVKVSHLPSGTTGNGLGVGIDFYLKNSTYSIEPQVATIEAVGISEAEIANDLVFKTKWQNALAERARFKGRGGTAGVVDFRLSNGNVIMGTSGNGIDFSATAGTGTSELLDDYEEGAWTPLFTDGTNNATMSIYNAGFYTKVGNLVTVSGYINASSLGSMSGNVKLAGLPFTTASAAGAHTGSSAGFAGSLNITAGQVVGMITDLNATTVGLKLWDASTGTTSLQASEMTANTVITINLTYRSA
jgi:hypothetical protein